MRITIAGTTGEGKTTVTRIVVDALVAAGLPVERIDDADNHGDKWQGLRVELVRRRMYEARKAITVITNDVRPAVEEAAS